MLLEGLLVERGLGVLHVAGFGLRCQRGIHCNSGIYTRYDRDPLQQHYLHTLQQGLTATAVFTHVTTGIRYNNGI